MGISVENADYVYRIEHLITVDAQIKFVSFEPLLGPLSYLPLSGIDWIIVGGESGPKAREIKPEWVRFIRDNCLKNEIPFFFKQWGGKQKWKSGRILDGRVWNEVPKRGYFIKSKFLKTS
jgi:protein gp37